MNTILQAQKISHIINSNFPHISTSRNVVNIRRLVINKKETTPNIKMLKIIDWHNNITDKFEAIRDKYTNNKNKIFKEILNQIKNNKVGNCYENAILAAGICKLNGINASVASLIKNNEEIDHVVCVFNKSGKPIKNNLIINNDTIILDPWLDIVDYANNYFAKNNSILEETISDIPNKGKYDIEILNNVEFTKLEKMFYKKNYHTLFINA